MMVQFCIKISNVSPFALFLFLEEREAISDKVLLTVFSGLCKHFQHFIIMFVLIKPLSNTKVTKQKCFLHKHFQRRPRYNEYNAQNRFEEKTPKHIQVAMDVYHDSKTINLSLLYANKKFHCLLR